MSVVINLTIEDDTAILTDYLPDMQRIMERLNTMSEASGLKLSSHKTKLTVIHKHPNTIAELKINNNNRERIIETTSIWEQ